METQKEYYRTWWYHNYSGLHHRIQISHNWPYLITACGICGTAQDFTDYGKGGMCRACKEITEKW